MTASTALTKATTASNATANLCESTAKHTPYCNNLVPYWTGGVREAVPGAAGLTQLRGASRTFVDPRKHVERADLTSYEAYVDDVQRGLAPNQYDAGVSVFNIADSLTRWGFSF